MIRRDFLKRSGAAALSSLLVARNLPAAPWRPAAAKWPLGLELFTVLNEMDKDAAGTLKKVAAIGYQEVESSFSSKGDFYGLKPQAFAALTKDVGLAWHSHMVPGAPFKLAAGAKMPTDAKGNPISIPLLKNLQENLQEVVDEAAAGGVRYLVCVSVPTATLDEVKASIDTLNKTAEVTRKAGLTLCYHNHDAEFKKIGGQVPYDLLLGQTDKAIKMELDLAWAVKAGVDPVELFRRYPGRFPLWHVKDLSRDHQTLEPVGKGSIDFKSIFANAQLAGLHHLFVEHDMPADPFGSITTSRQALSKLLG